MAGESARESARRQREKAERLQRSADLWEQGADGEQATADALKALPDSWTVFHDVRWPGRRYANVDHVAVGPGGVFVIDSKNWSGSIVVRDNVLRQNGRQRESTVVGAAESALAVHSVVPAVLPQHVMPVLCFVRDEPLSGWARDVMVCSTANIVDFLATRPEILPPQVRNEACLQLDAMFRSATAPSASTPPRAPTAARPAASRPPISAGLVRPPSKRTRTKPAATRRSSRSTGPVESLVRLAIVAVVALVFLGSPDLRSAIGEGVTKVFTPEVVTPVEPVQQQQPAKKQHHHKKQPSKDTATTR